MSDALVRAHDFGQAIAPLVPLSARLLGWRPDHFWSATPAELALATGEDAAAAAILPPDSETIARMMERDAL
ncbi:MAG: phage tail assembly chaperone [Erythrobacter sp.]